MKITSQTLARTDAYANYYNVVVQNDAGHAETFHWTAGKLTPKEVTIDQLEESLRFDAECLDNWDMYDDLGYSPREAHSINEKIRENVRKMEALGW